MIRRCTDTDLAEIEAIINEAAQAYKDAIPADCWHEPYMTRSELSAEIASGINFWGWDDFNTLIGVMGIQKVRDVTLIRHAYVRKAQQGQGVGGKLLTTLAGQAAGQLLVGTWAAAEWAIRFYERHGFRMVPTSEKNLLLESYWTIPLRQQETSVVLRYVPKPAQVHAYGETE